MPNLTPARVAIIKSTMPVLKEHGNTITTHFYATVLADHPSLRSVFNQANQANGHQALALASTLYAYASDIDDLGALSPTVQKICHKHASLNIQPAQYEVVGEYLLRAMGDVLGPALTPDVLDAWSAAYWQLARILIGREEELYQQADGWVGWRDFRIGRKVEESSTITSFYLEPVDQQPLPMFLPGQYISVETEVTERQYRQARQYSLSDAPNSRYYRISVKRELGLNRMDPKNVAQPGCISNMLRDRKVVGDILQISHPYGEFYLDPEMARGRPVVLLSAGVGVTPMISIATMLTSRGSTQPISFISGSRSSADRAFHTQLRRMESRNPSLRYTSFVKEPEKVQNGESTECNFVGRLSLAELDGKEHLLLNVKSTEYFVCGPEGFMAEVEAGLRDLGVNQSRIHLEIFGTGMPTRT